MLFLLPPSETKTKGGISLSISQAALTFGGLNNARDLVFEALVGVCTNEALAIKALKLTPKQLGEIQTNLELQSAPTMPAIFRYSGTLYDAIEAQSLTKDQLRRAKETVLIQTALFGLIPATDLIPNYRLAASSSIPGINLRKVWSEAHVPIWARLAHAPLIDMRSKSYAQLAPIPPDVESYWVEVVTRQNDGKLRALNHFNKLAKGKLVGAILRAENQPKTIADLQKIAELAGLELLQEANVLFLVTDQIKKNPKVKAKTLG